MIWLSKENKEFFHIELDRQGLSASLEAKCGGRLGLTQPRRGDQHDWTGVWHPGDWGHILLWALLLLTW